MIEVFFLLLNWAIPAILLFFLIYWAVRLAIRHEKLSQPSPRELEDRARHERVTGERAAQHREWEERQAQRGEEAEQ